MTLTNSTTLATRAHDGGVHDDTDPAAPPTRRSYSPEYKLAILTAYDEETEPGAKGAFLRREGLYSSQITEWRKAREAGSLAALGGNQRTRRSAERREVDRLKQKNETLKYCPAFPERFGSIEDARAFCAEFFDHYNHVHRHSGIALHTPASVHFGTATEIREQRQATLSAAYEANPLRFRHRPPAAPEIPNVAWINQPVREEVAQNP